jgi:hypothetical protein
VANLTADLRGLQLNGVSMTGGVGRADLHLPRPSGTVPIDISDGAASLSIRRPDGVELQVTLPDGGASVELDGRQLGPIGSHPPVESPGYGEATDRYDVVIRGGAAELTLAKG